MIFSNEIPTISKQTFRLRTLESKSALHKVSHFMIGQLLGKGGFGSVYKGYEIYTCSEVAVKVIGLKELSKKQIEQLRNEIQIQSSLNHPNIVNIYEAVWTEDKLYIFMELAKGKELFDYIVKRGPIKEVFAAKIFHQVCSAVKYLHDNGVAHRDIKAENIVIDENYNVKLLDFGLAKQFKITDDPFMETLCGSPSYKAPEIVQRRNYKGKEVDVWCLGVTLYVMLEAALPFDHQNDFMKKQKIKFINWEKPSLSSPDAVEIYHRVFRINSERISLEELLETNFFSKYYLKHQQYMSSDQHVACLAEDNKLIKEVAHFMKKSEQQIKTKVSQKKYGTAYCLFTLLHNQHRASRNTHLEVKSKREAKVTEELKLSTCRKRSSFSASKKNRQMRMLPLIKDEATCHLKTEQALPMGIQSYVREKVGQQIVGGRNKFVGKQLMRKSIFMADLPKPRLREDSPESPKRLIDCMKRYY